MKTTPVERLKTNQKQAARSPEVQQYLDDLPVKQGHPEPTLSDLLAEDSEEQTRAEENTLLRAAVMGLTWAVFAAIIAAAAWMMYQAASELAPFMSMT